MKITPQALLLLALLVSAAALRADNELYAPTKAARLDAEAYLTPFPKDGVVPYKVLAGDFSKNQTAAIGKYSGRRVAVVGRISAIKKSGGENKIFVVTLSDSSGNLPSVKADFLFGSLPENSELQVSDDGSQAQLIRRDRSGTILSQDPYLSVGQKVTIKGEFKQLRAGEIVLTACELKRK
jgi:hypothetical protein